MNKVIKGMIAGVCGVTAGTTLGVVNLLGAPAWHICAPVVYPVAGTVHGAVLGYANKGTVKEAVKGAAFSGVAATCCIPLAPLALLMSPVSSACVGMATAIGTTVHVYKSL